MSRSNRRRTGPRHRNRARQLAALAEAQQGEAATDADRDERQPARPDAHPCRDDT